MKYSTAEVVLTPDLVQAVRERANKRDGIIYDMELEYDFLAAVRFLVERGDLIEHGKGEGGLFHFYTFADAEHISDKPVHEGGALLRPGDHEHDLVEKTHTHALENATPEEYEEFVRAIAERNEREATDDPVAIHEARKASVKEQEEFVQATLEKYLEHDRNLNDPVYLAKLEADRQERILKAQLEEVKKVEVDGRTVTEIAADVKRNVDAEGRDLDLAKAYEEEDKAEAERRAAELEAEREAEVRRLENELRSLKAPKGAAREEEAPRNVDEMGRDLDAARAELEATRAEEEAALAEAERQKKAEALALQDQAEALLAEAKNLKKEEALPADHDSNQEPKDVEGRPLEGPDVTPAPESHKGVEGQVDHKHRGKKSE